MLFSFLCYSVGVIQIHQIMTPRDIQKLFETLNVLDTDTLTLYQRQLEFSESLLKSEESNVEFQKFQIELNKSLFAALAQQEQNNKVFFDSLKFLADRLEKLDGGQLNISKVED